MTERQEKFTPGQWKAHAGINDPDYVYFGDEDRADEEGRVVCECFLRPGRHEMSADVHLIAAAPEMYEALAEAVELYGKPGGPWNVPGEPGSWIAKATAALKKARGEE